MQLCFLMQLNPKLSMEAGKNSVCNWLKAVHGSAVLLGDVKCHLWDAGNCTRQPPAPPRLLQGIRSISWGSSLSASWVRIELFIQPWHFSIHKQPTCLSVFPWSKAGVLKEGCPSRLTEDQWHSWWLTPPWAAGRGFMLRWDVDMDPGELGPCVF